jgi:hypothetical protein
MLRWDGSSTALLRIRGGAELTQCVDVFTQCVDVFTQCVDVFTQCVDVFTQCVDVFCVDLTTNSDYFTVQH